ncbi:MFS transporter [Paeniglutamicibacter sp. R2-26]|uniref:MFS transporter n=1 Tax=Paeniglutamicibacter sp. R2-26 TaxID=3144417 RepID=UPI003EE46D6F
MRHWIPHCGLGFCLKLQPASIDVFERSHMTHEQTQLPRTANTKPPVRQVVVGVVGMMLEMYDWQVYGFMAVYLGAQIFNPHDPFAGLLSALLTYAVGFFVRPIGGALIGAYTDRFGRKAGMIVGMLMLGFGSLVIALMPTYAQVGVWAGIILVVARLIQGLGTGGEQGAAVSYLSEIAPEGKRALYNAFGYIASSVSVIFALLLAALLPRILGTEAMSAWGWRIPFILGALFTVFAVVMRRTMNETTHFTEAKQARSGRRSPLRDLLTTYRKQSLLAALFIAGGTFVYYVFVLQYSTFVNLVTDIELSQAQLLTTVVIIVFAALQPVFGWLSDRIGRKRILLASSFGMLVTIWPGFLSVTDNPAVVISLQMLAVVPAAASASVGNTALAELFPTEVRAIGVAFPYAISVALFGGTAPYIMAAAAGSGNVVWLAVYGSVLVLGTLVAVILMPDRANEPLHSAPIAAGAQAHRIHHAPSE